MQTQAVLYAVSVRLAARLGKIPSLQLFHAQVQQSKETSCN